MLDFRPSTEMDLLTSAASGMSTQRTVLDLAARNVAAAQASTPDHPYRRLVAQFADAAGSVTDDGTDPDGDSLDDRATSGSQIVGVHSQPGSGDSLAEMIAVLDAQRSFEQNASVFDIGKRLAERTIDIGRS